jgi:hypothetical protein
MSETDVLVLLQAWLLAHSIAEAEHNAQRMELVFDDHLRVMVAQLNDTRRPSLEGGVGC